MENRKKIIQRQQDAGLAIFFLASLVLIVGLVFSGVQFHIALKAVDRRGDHIGDPRGQAALPENMPVTSIKAGVGSVEVSSSFLGVIILVISLLFFYLYLDRVFPLSISTTQPIAEQMSE